MVWVGLLEESLELVRRRPHLMLAATCYSRDVPHGGATYFLIIAAIIVGRDCNPLRMLLAPLLTTLGALLSIMDGDIGRRLLATAWGHLRATSARVKFDRLIASCVLGDDIAQLLSGVPESVVRCLKGRRLLHISHATSGCLHPWSLGVTAVSPPITVFALVWATHAAFKG
jgi:hypothetical protein